MGAAHVVHITEGFADIYTVVRSNSISILWQLPQSVVITVGEILFSISGLEFSYSQATPNMRSVMQVIIFYKIILKFGKFLLIILKLKTDITEINLAINLSKLTNRTILFIINFFKKLYY